MVRYLLGLLLFPLAVHPELVPARALVGHVHVLQSLKERFANAVSQSKPKKTENTPTLRYLEAVKNGHLDPYYYGWSSYGYKDTAFTKVSQLKLDYSVDDIIAAEKEYCSDYYVFYHGQRSQFWLLQEFLKELYALIKIHSPLTQFEFLRMWHEAAHTYQVNSFIDSYEPKLPKDGQGAIWNDTIPDLIKNMLCVNLSIFGNLTYGGESSFNYFLSNSNASFNSIETILGKLFDHFGLNKCYIAQLKAQETWFSHKNGILLQIFVPKNKVDQYVYLSKAWGTPHRNQLDNTWNPAKKRHMKISTLLDKYIKEPQLMGNFAQLQARILLSQDCMLNPDSGVKILKYSSESQDNMENYKQAIKYLAKEVFVNALENKTFKNIGNTPLHKLLLYLPKK